jgi:hypothetical protein
MSMMRSSLVDDLFFAQQERALLDLDALQRRLNFHPAPPSQTVVASNLDACLC